MLARPKADKCKRLHCLKMNLSGRTRSLEVRALERVQVAYWPIAKFSVMQNSVAIGAWRTSSKPHPVHLAEAAY